MPDLNDSGDRPWPFQLTLAETSAKLVIRRGGVPAGRRKSLEIEGFGFAEGRYAEIKLGRTLNSALVTAFS